MRVLDGPDFDLIKYRGSPVITNIFATWCGPCNNEMPSLVASANNYYDRGLRLIGINFAESDDTVRAYRKRFSIPFPVAMAERGGFASIWSTAINKSPAFAVSLFITLAGFLYCYKEGSSEHPEAEMTYRIEKFLKDAPPTPVTSSSPRS